MLGRVAALLIANLFGHEFLQPLADALLDLAHGRDGHRKSEAI